MAIAIAALLLAGGFFAHGPGGTDSGDLYLWIGGLFAAIGVIFGWLGVTLTRRIGRRGRSV